MINLENKVVFVTGGSSGIGLATVQLLAKYGAKIIATYNNHPKDNFDNVEYVKMDVTNAKECDNVIKDALKKYERIDVLINNAGIVEDAKLEKMTEKQFDDVISVNLKGTFNVTKIIASHMKERNNGNIINIISVSGLYGNIGQTNYAASKAGILGMTYTWAKELGKKNIRVNAIAPGYTETNMVKEIPEKIANIIKEKIILNRFAKPEEIANAIVFLADDCSSYITGTVLNVDGGFNR